MENYYEQNLLRTLYGTLQDSGKRTVALGGSWGEGGWYGIILLEFIAPQATMSFRL